MATQDFGFDNRDIPNNGNLGVATTYPAVQYFPSETSGIYEEEREVNGEFWSVQNATYNTGSNQWLLVDPTKPARAFVSSGPKGDVEFRLSPAAVQPCTFVTKWSITDGGVASMSLQVAALPLTVDLSGIGIYNVCAPQYNAVPDINTPTQCALNTTAIQAACTDAVNHGGVVFFPLANTGGVFHVNPGIVVQGSTRYFSMIGTSAAVRIHCPTSSGGGTVFTIQTSGSSLGQVQVSNMSFAFDVPMTGQMFLVNAATELSFTNCIFSECPTAINITGALDIRVTNCQFANKNQSNCQVVICGDSAGNPANVFHMTNCLMRSSGAVQKGPLTNGTNNMALMIRDTEEFWVTDCQIEQWDGYTDPTTGFQWGIIGLLGAKKSKLQHGHFDNVHVDGRGTALVITPYAGGGIANMTFDACHFNHGNWHGVPYDTQPGVYINTQKPDGTFGPATTVTAIAFNGCTINSWGGPGLQVNGGQKIQVTGGRISGNALSAKGNLANVVVSGNGTSSVQGFSAENVDMQGNVGFEPGTAPYALFLDGGCTNVFVQHCNMKGVSNYAVVTGSPGANIEILDCPNYNDQGWYLSDAFPAGSLGAALSGAQIAVTGNWGNTQNPQGKNVPYFGKIECTVNTAGAAVKRAGKTTGLTSGVWTVYPGGNDIIEIDTSITGWLATGQ